MPFLRYAIPLILALWVIGCGKENDECVFIPDTTVAIDLQFDQLEDSVASIESKEQLVSFFTHHPVMRDLLFMRQKNYPNDSIFINSLFQRFTHPGFDTLLTETRKVFGDLSQLKEEFRQAFSNIKYYYPDFVPPKVQTIITGLESDLVITDTLIIVGLDYYLGKEGKYRPRLYDYLLTRYEPEDIVPSCLLIYGISGRFNKTNLDDKTILADMIAYGKSFYFAKHMLPCVPDSTFIWYTSEEINGSKENERLIWARFIEDQILFSTSHITKQKFLGERPKTLEVGEKCPGRIAQWIGWRIVDKYMESHPEVTLPQLMEMTDAEKIFKESRYKPL
ncbi:MAG TPA: gliding motility lipoprotein GldB [Cyclobacteriaceae bacterium]|nr:gliding motility lipoprotein GldB [Cyclobacteriaceae bacterium]